MMHSIKDALQSKSFSSLFSFSNLLFMFNYMTVIYPSLNKLWKTFIKVVKMSHFVFYRSKRCTQKNVFEVDQELGGRE